MKLSKILFSVLFLFIALTACKENGLDNMENRDSFSDDISAYDFSDAMAELDDATLDKAMGFNEGFTTSDYPAKGFSEKHKKGIRHKNNGMKRVFRAMKLTPEQREQVKTFHIEFRECIVPAVKSFREAAKPFIEEANEARKAIREQVRAGELTREEAREQIKALNIETKEKIQNDPTCQEAKEAMCNCRTTFLDSIESILVDSQIEIWEKWKTNHPGSC